MITKVSGESPFQILSNAFSISPSQEGYTLQISADGRNFSNLFSVSPNVTRLVTGVSSGSFYRLLGNQSEVSVNWQRTCSTGGSDGNAQELQPVSEFPLSPIDGTVVALSSGGTVGVYQFDGTEWTSVGGSDLTDYYTKQETDAAISASTSPIQEQLNDVERVTASALTEIHEDILDISAATGNFYTKAQTDTAIADAIADIPQPDLSNYYTKDQIAVKEEVISRALNDLHDDISGATSDFYTKQEVDTAISTATANKVSSASVSTIWRGSQADYDAITTKDPNTLYIIVNS